MEQISLQAVPSQRLSVVLANQNVQLFIYQKDPCIFVDINSDNQDISIAVRARDSVPLNSEDYQPFSGNLIFIDTQGNEDPYYTGLGVRWQLIYLTADEYTAWLEQQSAGLV